MLTGSVTHAPPFTEYFILKLVTLASSRFFIRALMVVVAVNAVEVNLLPEVGAVIATIFRSLSEIVPEHVPLSGCLETA